ncbi:g1168 [Coccomyxa viridis]|uniref:G1168 protein n=1 Tax=Coccomyxa viridis TaxID=1274662 RepID=A0ABP1FMT0_9CHLO
MSQRIGPFLAGIGVVTAAYISGRALIWDRAEKISEAWPCAPPPKQPLSGATPFVAPQTRALMQQKWNAAVDSTFKPMIRFLSDRGL